MHELVVLCYHGISDSWPAETTVRRADFEAQLTSFAKAGFRGARLSDALVAPPEGRTLVVTFDDAHRSVLALAAPVMARLGLVGTIYVPTAYAGTDRHMAWDGYDRWMDTEHADELLCLGWDDLRGLAERGWEIGSHTRTHPHLPRLGDDELARELTESKAECEAGMGVACEAFAYPYSDFDDRVVRAAAAAGYRSAVTVPRGPTPPLPWQWPRVGVYNGEDANRVRFRVWSRGSGTRLAGRIPPIVRRVLH